MFGLRNAEEKKIKDKRKNSSVFCFIQSASATLINPQEFALCGHFVDKGFHPKSGCSQTKNNKQKNDKTKHQEKTNQTRPT